MSLEHIKEIALEGKCDVDEKFETCKIALTYSNSCLPQFNDNFFNKIMLGVNKRDDLEELSVQINDNGEAIIVDINDIKKTIREIELKLKLTDTIENISVNIYIQKRVKDYILSIYDISEINKYLNKLKLSEIINNLYKLKSKNIYYLQVQNIETLFIQSDFLCFIGKNDNASGIREQHNYTVARKEVCNLLNSYIYDFEPQNFDFKIDKNYSWDFIDVFKKLKIVYSLIFIFNISQISENILDITLNGYKSVKFTIVFDDIDIEKLDVFNKIFEWVYEDNKIEEKIELARNVISLYLNNSEGLYVENGIIDAIQSNYKIYLKDNVEKYFSVKSKAVEEILDMTDSISSASNNVAEGIISNLKVIGTFIITVIVMNSLSDKKLDNIFTNDIKGLSIALSVMSFIYLWYTVKDTHKKRKDIMIKYCRLKLSYNDILVSKDIERIFKNDRFIRKDFKRLDDKIKIYTKVWILSIIVFIVTVLVLGR